MGLAHNGLSDSGRWQALDGVPPERDHGQMVFEVVDGPRIEHRGAVPTVGIRLVTPFRGMLATRDRLLGELFSWLEDRGVETEGPFYLRLHVVDMAADMDIEVGVAGVVAEGDGRVTAGTMPAGEYAILAYRGSSLQANRMLLGWVDDSERSFDADPASGAWAGRYEILRTDPRVERRKTAWTTELAFLVQRTE